MTRTEFPFHAPANDFVSGYLTVQKMVEYLRDVFDKNKDAVLIGTTTVPNGATTMSVGFPSALSVYNLSLTPLADPGGRFWVSGKTSTGFTINLGVAAPVQGIAFDWIAKGVA